MNEIVTTYASSLKGYCSVALCQQFMHEVSSQLAMIHAEGKAHGAIDLQHVCVNDRHFNLLPNNSHSVDSLESDIWQLAASAMELVLGSPIFNGCGERQQKSHTPIPALPQQEANELNRLLCRCLCYDPSLRPTAMEINKATAATIVEKRPPRFRATTMAQENLALFDRLWPEKMVATTKKRLIILLPLLLSTILTFGQCMDGKEEAVTNKLLNATLLLRQNNNTNWNTAREEFAKWMTQFTLMNELTDPENDCALIPQKVQSFGVNRLIGGLKRNEVVQNTGKGLLDGSDSRFRYAIYEKGVKAGCTSTYELRERYGKQVFAVIPHDVKQSYTVILVKEDGSVIRPVEVDANGVSYFLFDNENEGNLYLKLTNSSTSNAAFVIINHKHRTK